MAGCASGLTDLEKAVLRLRAEGLSDYRIARRLHSYTNSVRRSRLNALAKIERAKVDLEFAQQVGVKIAVWFRCSLNKQTANGNKILY